LSTFQALELIPVQQGALVLRLMTQFARDFVSSIEGNSSTISTKELSGGARIYYIFSDVFGHALACLDSTQNLENQDIRTAIRNSTGPRPSLFVPELAFELLVKPQIKLLEQPSLRCVELVYEELVKICHNCASAVHSNHCYPALFYMLTNNDRNFNDSRVCTHKSSRLYQNFSGND
jgi:replication fork clamp-binding protein CrfC